MAVRVHYYNVIMFPFKKIFEVFHVKSRVTWFGILEKIDAKFKNIFNSHYVFFVKLETLFFYNSVVYLS